MLTEETLKPEMDKILEAMSNTKPDDEKYVVLLNRYKGLFTMAMALRKSEQEQTKQADDINHRAKEFESKTAKEKADDDFRNRELDWKIQKDVDDYNAKVDIENNRVTLEKQRIDIEYEKLSIDEERNKIEREKIKADKIKNASDDAVNVIKTVSDTVQTFERVKGGILVTLIGAKVTMAMSKAILTDEAGGNLVFSKVFNYIPKPNPFNFKLM